jgi:uncharacterized membrane protein YgcG
LSRKPVVLGTLALVAALAPAHAGTVYVPTIQQSLGGVRYRTEIVVANPGTAASQLTTSFIPSGSDGTRAAQQPASLSILPSATFVLTNAAPAGRDGLLEVSGAGQIAVTARLVAVAASGQILGSAPLPAVGSQNLIAQGGVAQIQGISRLAGVVQRFGLINLGSGAASCAATPFRSNGALAGGTAGFTVPARSHAAFAVPLTGTARASDLRVEVTCDQPFYPYALQISSKTGLAAFLAPSATLESELLEATGARGDGDDGEGGHGGGGGRSGGGDDGNGGGSGGNGGSGGGPVTGQDSLSFSGVFLDAVQSNSTRAFALPLRAGVRYRKVTVEFDLYLNQWQSPLFHAVTSLRRNDRTLYYGLILRGDKAKTLIDLGKEQMAKGDGPWKERTQYHVRMETDAGSQTVTLKLFQGGNLVHTVSGGLVSTDLSAPSGKTVSVDFGIGRVADGAYFPPVGWKYSNLVVKAEPF